MTNPEILAIRTEPTLLTVDWTDGTTSRFHAIWLRHQCTAPECGSPIDGLRSLWLEDIPEDIAIIRAVAAPERIEIAW